MNHTYRDNIAENSQVQVTVYDRQSPPGSNDNSEGSGQDVEFLPIKVSNVAPTFARDSISVTKSDGLVVVQGKVDDPGAADTHVVRAGWGDGPPAPTRCTVGEGRRFRCEHSYESSSSRTYTIRLLVTDDDSTQGTATTSVQIP